MKFQRKIKRLIEWWIGQTIHLYRNVPRGIDLFDDIRRYLPRTNITCVFDVGANIGQSAENFARELPGAEIFCFEPVAETFAILKHNTAKYPYVRCFMVALAEISGIGKMVTQGASDLFFLQKSAHADTTADLEAVVVDTLGAVAIREGLDRIGYLKIDAEGGDLDVLRGAELLLQEQRIDIIQIEAGMNSKNTRHVPFEVFRIFLEDRGYFLFGIYEQVGEWPKRQPHLRRTNPVYISNRVVLENQSI